MVVSTLMSNCSKIVDIFGFIADVSQDTASGSCLAADNVDVLSVVTFDEVTNLKETVCTQFYIETIGILEGNTYFMISL